MGASEEQRMLLVLLLLFSSQSKQTAESSQPQGLQCIIFNEDYMTCDWGSQQRPTANYSLYYWYENEGSVQECECYLQNDGVNTGCRFSQFELNFYFHVYLNTSHSTETPTIEAQMNLQDQVKPNPPMNLTIQNISTNQLLLTWGSSKIHPRCLLHEVKYKSNKDTEWQKQEVHDMKFTLPSVDPNKFYTFFVRSKMNIFCSNSDFWSDEAGPIFWGGNVTCDDKVPSLAFWVQSIMIPIGSLFLLIFLFLALIRMERVWLILMPRIPNPSNKFEDLFTEHKGNFSEWAGVSKDAVESFKPNYRESICRVSELLPAGGYLPVYNEAMGKTGGVANVSVDPNLKANTVE